MQQKAPLFRKPLYKDWIIWLAVIAIIAGISSAMSGYNPDEEMSDAMVIDIVFAIGFQFALFGLVPASIRRAVANKKATANQ